MEIEKQITDYFRCIDESLDMLSLHKEGELTGLPSWVHTTRSITIGITDDGDGIALKVNPDNSLIADVTKVVSLKSTEDINKVLTPMTFSGTSLSSLAEDFFMLVGDMVVTGDNPLLPPALDNRFLVGWGRRKGFENTFNIEKAKEESLDLWNKRLIDKKAGASYVREVNNILYRFQAVIKRKAFLERRIHRFVYQYKDILLPSHRRCLYEHILYRETESRKADFILEREQGLPPILIELESPVHPVLTKTMDLTAPANHARRQISEWVSFIDSDAVKNASGKLNFLTGPKERLVIIGRGLEHKERLIGTKFDGVAFWTYDMFIKEIRHRLNGQYASQCQMVGLEIRKPF